ncbi:MULTISPECIES: putative zinc-binding protein [unclassified Oleiphilus]|uniref:putative zinc-binding protein n=1 Tax=unclassified Oleiphilus TaxID=2631174 RepID=UPI0026F41FA3|nr:MULTISPECIES: putative zinc-binding protein [unclassified Oleiphilus]
MYSCSGCSNVAQLTNQLALELNRLGQAEMSCIAGVGGQVKSLVRQAKSERPILALDGCALHCVKQCLNKVQVTPTLHLTLTDLELKKVKHQNFSKQEFEHAYTYVSKKLSSIQSKPQTHF